VRPTSVLRRRSLRLEVCPTSRGEERIKTKIDLSNISRPEMFLGNYTAERAPPVKRRLQASPTGRNSTPPAAAKPGVVPRPSLRSPVTLNRFPRRRRLLPLPRPFCRESSGTAQVPPAPQRSVRLQRLPRV